MDRILHFSLSKFVHNRGSDVRVGFLIGLLLFFSVSVNLAGSPFQERIVVKGMVKALDNNEALPGVNVIEKGTTNGTTTGINGEFSIAVPAGSTLMFSFVGHSTEEVVISDQTELSIMMSPDIQMLQELVVVGYGVVKKGDVTGSVVSLKSDQLTPGANVSVEQIMQGRVAGVQVYQKSGEPGSAMSVKIRGISSIGAGNDPLYVIDGMPVNNLSPVGSPSVAGISVNPNARNPLNGINPADIESIEILKDASATAIYGARGSNGVVLITTKRGTSGELKINYNVQYGVQRAANSLDMLSGEEYRDALNAIIDAGGGVASERVADDVENVDWQKELYRSAAVQSHDLSISGGKDHTKFYTSIGYFKQEGVLPNSGTERYSVKLNIENAIDKKYAYGMNLSASYIHDNFNSVGLGVNENGSALYSAIFYDPTFPVYNDNGDYNRSPYMTTIDHPLALMEGQYANSDSYRIFGTVYGEYFFLPELSAKVKISGDVNSTRRNSWVDPVTIVGNQSGGIASINTGNVNYYMLEGTLNYTKELSDDHAVNAVLGTTYEHFGSNSFGGSGRNYTAPDLSYDAIGTGNAELNQIGSGRASAIITSVLGRVNYTFRNRYLLTASFRADGSSRFGPNNRFGYFPSAAVAWKIQEEPFMNNIDFIDELKLRGSYGSVGSQAIANYLYVGTYSAGNVGPVFDGERHTIIQPTRVPNPDLQWESSVQGDIGIDFSFFARRLSGSLEYYNRKTSDLLLDLPQPTSTGFGYKTENVGSMRNSGIELMLSGDVIRNDNVTWTVGGNFATLKNEVISLGPLKQIFTGDAGFIASASIIKPGESLGSYYGYEVLGVWQQGDDFTGYPASVKPGDLKYAEVVEDKVINASDRKILGKALPDFTYGITSTVTYKNLSLSIFMEGSYGASVLNAVAVDSYFPVSFRRNRLAEPYLNRWTPENPTNEYPSFINPTSQGQQQVNSRTLEDASYLRMQSVRLGYNLNFSKSFIRNLQVYVTGQNLFTITKYSGIDPAVNSIGSDVLKIDYSAYPMTRTFLLGMNFQF